MSFSKEDCIEACLVEIEAAIATTAIHKHPSIHRNRLIREQLARIYTMGYKTGNYYGKLSAK